jgi:hypothetical protein
MAPCVLLLVSVIVGWTESPLYGRLFTPAAAPADTYRTYVTPRSLDAVLAEIGVDVQPKAVMALEAFGQSGGYDRWKLARLYGARRARVARTPRFENGRVVEAWTMISPYPDPSLERLDEGTLLIVLRLH